MDKSTIVISVNVAYVVLFLTVLFKRLKQYDDKVWVRKDGEQTSFEYFGYTLAGGMMYILMLTFPLFRNRHVFEQSFPITFILQFVAQFIILILYLVDTKVTRIMVSYGIAGFLVFMFLNGLVRIEMESTKLELTTSEVQKISKDLDEFSVDVTDNKL